MFQGYVPGINEFLQHKDSAQANSLVNPLINPTLISALIIYLGDGLCVHVRFSSFLCRRQSARFFEILGRVVFAGNGVKQVDCLPRMLKLTSGLLDEFVIQLFLERHDDKPEVAPERFGYLLFRRLISKLPHGQSLMHPIVSLGGGAMSKVPLPGGALKRFPNPKYPEQYLSSLDKVLRQKEELFSCMEGGL